jgi:hypothetical protein
MSDDPAGGKPENGIYTVLLILATVMLGAATIYLAVRGQQLFGTWNPFG